MVSIKTYTMTSREGEVYCEQQNTMIGRANHLTNVSYSLGNKAFRQPNTMEYKSVEIL